MRNMRMQPQLQKRRGYTIWLQSDKKALLESSTFSCYNISTETEPLNMTTSTHRHDSSRRHFSPLYPATTIPCWLAYGAIAVIAVCVCGCNTAAHAAAELVLSPAAETELLDAHNLLRSNVEPSAARMRAMVWSSELASVAREHAARCTTEPNPTSHSRSPSFPYVGENIGVMVCTRISLHAADSNESANASSTNTRSDDNSTSEIEIEEAPARINNGGAPAPTHAHAPITSGGSIKCNLNFTAELKRWFAERDNNFTSSSSTSSCSHCSRYQQMVAQDSNHVGCGIAECSSSDATNGSTNSSSQVFLVCNYGPAMIPNSSPYATGVPCSDCPSDAPVCSNNLCTISRGTAGTNGGDLEVTDATNSHTIDTSCDRKSKKRRCKTGK